MKKFFGLIIFALIILTANCHAANLPPSEYVLNEFMPYGDGTAGVNTRLKMNGVGKIYNLPRGSKVVGDLQPRLHKTVIAPGKSFADNVCCNFAER